MLSALQCPDLVFGIKSGLQRLQRQSTNCALEAEIATSRLVMRAGETLWMCADNLAQNV